MAQIVSDNFTRANAGTLGANWTVPTGAFVTWSIVSNQANTLSSGGFNNLDLFNGASWTGGADQYAEITMAANVAANDGGVMCRMVTANGSGYMLDINNPDSVALGSSQHLDMFEISTGDVFTAVGSGITAITISVGDVLRIEAQGTTIRGFVNGVSKITGTNASHASGNPGMRWFAATANGSKVSLFAAGDFSASGGAAVGRIPQMFHPGRGTLAAARFYQTPKGFNTTGGPIAYTQTFTAALTFIGTQAKRTSRTLPAGLTFIGSATKFTLRTLPSAGLTFTGAVAKQTAKPLNAALTLSGATAKVVAKALTASVAFVGVLPRAITRTLAAALAFVGATAKATSRSLSAALSFVGSLSPSRLKLLTLTAAVSFSGAFAKQTNKALPAALTFSGAITRFITRSLAASLTFVGTTAKQTSRLLSAGVSFSGAFSKQTNKLATAALTFSGTISKAISHGLTAVLSFTGSIAKRTSRGLTAGLSFVGNLATFLIHAGGTAYTLTLTASVSFVGAISKQTRRSMTASLGTIGAGIGPRVVLIGQRLALRITNFIYEWLD